MNILALLLLVSSTSAYYNVFKNVTIEKEVIQSIVLSPEKTYVLALTSDSNGIYFESYDFNGDHIATNSLNINNFARFRDLYWLQQDDGAYLIFESSDALTQVWYFSNQLNKLYEKTLSYSVSATSARKSGNITSISMCLTSGSWKEYKVSNNNWIQANTMTLSDTFLYTQIVYTSDGLIVCLIGHEKLLLTHWTIICYDISNIFKIVQFSLTAVTMSIHALENTHQLIVSINETSIYKLSLDSYVIKEEILSFNKPNHIYSIITCSAEVQSQLIAFLGEDSSGSKKLVLASDQNQQLNLFQNLYFSSQFDIKSVNLAICKGNYIVGYFQQSFFIIQNVEYSIGVWAIIISVSLGILLTSGILLTYKKQKFIFLKNLKIYYRTNKLLYILCALTIAFINLKLMLLFFQSDKYVTQTCISYFIQYFLLIFVITIHECKTEYDELHKHMKMYRLQGISIASYFFQRISYLLLFVGLLSIINTAILPFFQNDYIKMEGLQDFIIIISAFLLCSLSNLAFCLMVTVLIKNFYALIEILFFYHFMTLFSMGLIQYENPILDFYLYFNGIYTYYYIFSSRLNHVEMNSTISAARMEYGFAFGVLQIFAYFSVYMIVVYLKHRITNTKQHLQNQSIVGLLMAHIYEEQSEVPRILEVRNLSKLVQKNKILSQICFEVIQGQIFVIYGPNQTGKTTLVNSILSLQRIDTGYIAFKEGLRVECCLANCNYFQELTFVEHIQFLCEIKNIKKDKIPQIIQKLTDDFYFDRDANKRASQLSGGSLKKLCLALTFIGQPNLLILDEPSLGLDANFKKIFWKMLKTKKMKDNLTIVVTTSNREEAEFLGDRFFLIGRNKTVVYFQQSHLYSVTFNFQTQDNYQELQQILQNENQQFHLNPQEKQIILETTNQALAGSQFIHSLIFNERMRCNLQIFNGSKRNYDINQDQLSNLLSSDYKQQKTLHYITTQIGGLIAKRWNICKYYFSLTCFTILIQLAVLNLREMFLQETITAFLLLARFFIYFENGVIRNEEINKKRYLNALIFGINKKIYWIFSLIPDFILLFIMIQVVYAFNQLILHFLFDAYSFDWFLSLFLLIYSALYVGITYFLSMLITNYLSYLFFFFYFNGFCFYFVLYIHYKDLQLPSVIRYLYFSETFFYFNINSADRLLILYLFLQMIVWYLLFTLELYISESIQIKRPISLLPDQYYKASQDQKKQQYAIEDLNEADLLDVPLIGDNIFQSYNNSNYIIKNMSILLKKGEIYSLIGSNGAGKSTFFNIMTGILKPTMGKIKYFGQDLHKMSFKDHIRVGYCPQFDYLYDILTVQQNISYYGKIKGMSAKEIQIFAKNYLQYFQIYDQLKVRVCKLSGGNRRKVSSILTFIGNPSLLFLDEPCSGMDRYSKIKLWNLISTYCKAKGASAILTTHYVSEVERYCTRIGILKDGKLISIGKPRQLVQTYSFQYRLIIKYKSQDLKQYIKETIQQGHQFYHHFEPPGDSKLIYDFEISRTNYRQLLRKIVFQLLDVRKILYFQFFSHNLQNVMSDIEGKAHQKDSSSSDQQK